MPKFYDIKLKDYIYFPRFKNLDFASYVDQKHDYKTADISAVLCSEKAIFSYNDFKDFILNKSKS
jgi:hypothetical protein